jgi:hypothetical protein
MKRLDPRPLTQNGGSPKLRHAQKHTHKPPFKAYLPFDMSQHASFISSITTPTNTMPLFGHSSPSKSSLAIPKSSSATSINTSRSPSPNESGLGRGTQAIQEETFRNVKLIEELLRAWNEHRQALSACAKTGKKLAKAMEELGHGVDKTSITGSLSPTK